MKSRIVLPEVVLDICFELTKPHIMKKILIVPMLLLFLNSQAQKTDQPDYSYKLGGKIEYMKLSDAGVLVVAGRGGLAGIMPNADAPHFNFNEYGRVKTEELEFVPASPYLIVSQGGLMSSKKTVIDIITGQVLFATEENGWKTISEIQVVLPENKLLVVGNRMASEKSMLAVGIYDLGSGIEEVLASLDPNVGKVRAGNGIPISSGRPYLTANSVLVPTSKRLVAIDLVTGAEKWEADVDKISWMAADASGEEIYTFEERTNGDTRIQKVNTRGEVLWKDERKLKGRVSRLEILPQGIAVVSDVDNSGKSGIAKLAAAASESKIAFLNAANGEDLWDKAPKTKGYVQHFYIVDDGILFGMHSGGINKISFDGQVLFKKPLNTGENIHTMATTPQGLIYITDTDAGIINLSTGDSVWERPIKYKRAKGVASAYDQKHKRYLISTGEEIVAIDEDTGAISTLGSLDFKEKEVPNALTVREDGLLLTSSQNIQLIDFDGKTVYHKYHKSPGQSSFTKIATGVVGVAALAMASAAAYQGGRYGTYRSSSQLNSYGEQMKIQQEGYTKIATVSFEVMNRRFRATSATANAQFILTNLEGGVGLVKVNKNTGMVEREILLRDRKPTYEVDELSGLLYYQAKDDQIVVFKL